MQPGRPSPRPLKEVGGQGEEAESARALGWEPLCVSFPRGPFQSWGGTCHAPSLGEAVVAKGEPVRLLVEE